MLGLQQERREVLECDVAFLQCRVRDRGAGAQVAGRWDGGDVECIRPCIGAGLIPLQPGLHAHDLCDAEQCAHAVAHASIEPRVRHAGQDVEYALRVEPGGLPQTLQNPELLARGGDQGHHDVLGRVLAGGSTRRAEHREPSCKVLERRPALAACMQHHEAGEQFDPQAGRLVRRYCEQTCHKGRAGVPVEGGDIGHQLRNRVADRAKRHLHTGPAHLLLHEPLEGVDIRGCVIGFGHGEGLALLGA